MSWLFEDPTYVLLFGGATIIGLIIALMTTRRGVLLFVIAGAALVVGLLVLVERLVVTDRERVENTIYDVAAAAETNDIDKILQFVSPQFNATRSLIKSRASRFKIEWVRVGRDLDVQIDDTQQPLQATAKFLGSAQVKDRMGQAVYEHFVGRVTVSLHKEGDRWLIDNFDIQPFNR